MVIPVSVMEAWTRASRFKLSTEFTLGDSLALLGDRSGGGLFDFIELGLDGVAALMGTLSALTGLGAGSGINAISGDEWNEWVAERICVS